MPPTFSRWTATTCALALVDAKGQPRDAVASAAEWHFHGQLRKGEIGPDLFRHACLMRLKDLASKRSDRPYRAGRLQDWVKVKTALTPMDRLNEQSPNRQAIARSNCNPICPVGRVIAL
jgi:hypothetical protein